MMPVKSKEEKKKPTGNIRCSVCNYINALSVDPAEEFSQGREVHYVCRRCGHEESLKEYHQLQRPCFDCSEVAVGRFWMNFQGNDVFYMVCPKGHSKYVLQSAFGPVSSDYDPNKVEDLIPDYSLKPRFSKASPSASDLRSLIWNTLSVSQEGMTLDELIEVGRQGNHSADKVQAMVETLGNSGVYRGSNGRYKRC